MNKTKIEWTNYTWNPIVGCLKGCSYCYARKIALRFAGDFKPRFFERRLEEPLQLRTPSKIFVCSMGEMFGDWIPEFWIKNVLDTIRKAYWHTFIILSKQPHNLPKWTFPPNVWLGITIDGEVDYGTRELLETNAKIKFVSFEPLLGEVNINFEGLDWIIIGAQTNPEKQPNQTWVKQLLTEAKKTDIPVFMKNNLKFEPKIQEFPLASSNKLQRKL